MKDKNKIRKQIEDRLQKADEMWNSLYEEMISHGMIDRQAIAQAIGYSNDAQRFKFYMEHYLSPSSSKQKNPNEEKPKWEYDPSTKEIFKDGEKI